MPSLDELTTSPNTGHQFTRIRLEANLPQLFQKTRRAFLCRIRAPSYQLMSPFLLGSAHQKTNGIRARRKRSMACTAFGVGSWPTWSVPLRSMRIALRCKGLDECVVSALNSEARKEDYVLWHVDFVLASGITHENSPNLHQDCFTLSNHVFPPLPPSAGNLTPKSGHTNAQNAQSYESHEFHVVSRTTVAR